MICAILAAGYATRLYPLTENFPKPLLKIGEKTILDHLLSDIDATLDISRYVVISNHKFYEHFGKWAQSLAYKAPVTVLDDGSVSNETRLGAVRDIQFAIDSERIDDDLLVIAGDNVLDFSLGRFGRYFYEKGTSCIMRYYVTDTARLKKGGVMSVDDDDVITRMEEKPEIPFDNWCAPPFYIYKKDDLPFVKKALDSGISADAPGSFMAYLSTVTKVSAMLMPGSRYDIGNLESYEQAQKTYKGITK